MHNTLSFAAPLANAFYIGCLTLLLEGCATGKDDVKPKPQTIHLRGDASVSKPAELGVIKKDLFNIIVSNNTLTVNGVAIKNLAQLDKFLSGYQQPALTVATHKCLSNEKAVEVISLAQRHTDVPIAFGSYGSIDDPECKAENPSRKR